MTKKKISKDWKHPELKKDEVFLTNSTNGLERSTWKTKRVGGVAYNMHGEILKGYKPVFVKRQELEKAKIEIQGKYNITFW